LAGPASKIALGKDHGPSGTKYTHQQLVFFIKELAMDWAGLRAVMWFGLGWLTGVLTFVIYFCWGLWNEGNK